MNRLRKSEKERRHVVFKKSHHIKNKVVVGWQEVTTFLSLAISQTFLEPVFFSVILGLQNFAFPSKIILLFMDVQYVIYIIINFNNNTESRNKVQFFLLVQTMKGKGTLARIWLVLSLWRIRISRNFFVLLTWRRWTAFKGTIQWEFNSVFNLFG